MGAVTTADQRGHGHNAALLIDFDNVTMGIRSDLQAQLRELLDSEIIKGKVAVQRAYADWRRYPQYIVPLSEASIDLIFAPAFGSNKKNATDIRLAIDALELVFTRPEIGTFILLSGDSDFSSLVLKLKEYGKYIIGVGIRESSSDLLIQNCDEYYSYTEVTGLSKEGDVGHLRRDPWELVVEAASRMKRERDVMRSDRLKQVMQSIDPNFDEKEAGFNRFSRFVVAAAGRGLLTLEKLDNGQYAIELGSNANVPPEEEGAPQGAERPPREPGTRSRRKRSPRRREGEPKEKEKGITLGEAFELLRKALMAMGAGDEASEADQVRAKMIELLGSESDPVFDRSRFQRLMRQAHDADVIELVKGDGNVYLLKLNPDAPPVEVEPPAEADAAADDETGEAPKRRRTTKRKTAKSSKSAKSAKETKSVKSAKGKTSTKRTRSRKPAGESAPAEEAPVATGRAAEQEGGKSGRHRNPRYRRGSRGGEAPARKPDEGQQEAATQGGSPPASSGSRSLRARGGSRRGKGAPGREREAVEKPQRPVREPEPEPQQQRVREPEPQQQRVREPEPEPEPQAAPPEPPAAPQPEEPAGGGLLRRMTDALSKVVKGPESE
jgi:uncharacterized protein (TIGR00288 family)